MTVNKKGMLSLTLKQHLKDKQRIVLRDTNRDAELGSISLKNKGFESATLNFQFVPYVNIFLIEGYEKEEEDK